ncbi:MAG: sugar phosphate isomerase/epimerase family protein [Sphingobacteriales bacterium]|jgi:sugar phosphate isomerase/epimerase
MNRRNFLEQSAMGGSALILSGLEVEENQPVFSSSRAGYEMTIMATNWGFEGSADTFCAAAKKEGYDGIEVWMPGDEKGRNEIATAANKHGLLLGLLYGGSDKDATKHLQQFKEGLQAAVGLKPIYINTHSGRDYFTMEQNKPFMAFTSELSAKTGIPIYHETHRGRSLFAAHVTRDYLRAVPDLRLTLDISHWCAVHESGLEDQEETVAMVLEKTEHIHARIGHSEGPQVNDPRAPEWDYIVKRHWTWWDKIVERKKREGKRMTILTEFGPPYYLPTMPYTNLPVADQWAINVHMLQSLRKRYR